MYDYCFISDKTFRPVGNCKFYSEPRRQMEIVDIEENLNAQLKKDYEAQKDGFVQVGERKWFYPWRYRKTAEELKNFEVRPDDIWITGFPRSGTTLTEEIVWLLSHDLDFDKARDVELSIRVKFFELDIVINEKVEKETIEQFPEEAANFARRRNILNSLREAKTRRVIKTHLPFELLPDDIFKKGCKVIYVCRYPKDVCVSYYFLQSNNNMMKFRGGFEKYWRYFKDGYCTFGPYFEHVEQGFKLIGSKNFEFVFYEDFKTNIEAYIKKLSELLEITISEEELEKFKEYMDLDNFRKVTKTFMKTDNNEPLTDFVRRGKVDGWRDHFTEQMNKEADAWIQMHTEKIGIKYPQQKK